LSIAGLSIVDCRLPIADCRLSIVDCRLPIADLGSVPSPSVPASGAGGRRENRHDFPGFLEQWSKPVGFGQSAVSQVFEPVLCFVCFFQRAANLCGEFGVGSAAAGGAMLSGHGTRGAHQLPCNVLSHQIA
jgi:hypothetical protein